MSLPPFPAEADLAGHKARIAELGYPQAWFVNVPLVKIALPVETNESVPLGVTESGVVGWLKVAGTATAADIADRLSLPAGLIRSRLDVLNDAGVLTEGDGRWSLRGDAPVEIRRVTVTREEHWLLAPAGGRPAVRLTGELKPPKMRPWPNAEETPPQWLPAILAAFDRPAAEGRPGVDDVPFAEAWHLPAVVGLAGEEFVVHHSPLTEKVFAEPPVCRLLASDDARAWFTLRATSDELILQLVD